MRYTKRARALVALAVMGACFIGGLEARASETHRHGYDAVVLCNTPLTRAGAKKVALVKYHWTYYGTLTLRYYCNTQIARGTGRVYRYPATVYSRAPMAEDSAGHVKLVGGYEGPWQTTHLTYRTRTTGY